MSRNSSGTYTLPTGNPVVSGTVIEANWANSTLDDISAALTDSLSRSGKGSMSASLRIIDGSVSVPGWAFANETGSGAYRSAAGDWYLTVLGSNIARLRSSGMDVTGALGVSGALTCGALTPASVAVTGNATVGGTLGITGNFAINTNKVTVEAASGNTAIAGTLGVTGVATLTANPTLSAGAANGIAYLNGSKSLVSGSNLVFDGSKLGILKSSPYATLDVGTTGAQVLTSLFTTGIDDLNFRIGFANGVAGSTGSDQGKVGLFYLGTGEAATISFIKGSSTTDGSIALRTNNTQQVLVDSSGNMTVAGSISADGGGTTPVGQVSFFAQSTAPAGWLKANGAAISRTTYSSLFQKIVTDAGFTPQTFTVTIASPAVFTKTAHGFIGGELIRLSTTGALPTGLNTTTDYYVIYVSANTFRVSTTPGGTAVNTSGSQSGTQTYLQSWYGLGNGSTTFNVPDLRSMFLRGVDDGRGIVAGRQIGSYQDDAVQDHTHNSAASSGGNHTLAAGSNVAAVGGSSTGGMRTGNVASETRPANIAMIACIKY